MRGGSSKDDIPPPDLLPAGEDGAGDDLPAEGTVLDPNILSQFEGMAAGQGPARPETPLPEGMRAAGRVPPRQRGESSGAIPGVVGMAGTNRGRADFADSRDESAIALDAADIEEVEGDEAAEAPGDITDRQPAPQPSVPGPMPVRSGGGSGTERLARAEAAQLVGEAGSDQSAAPAEPQDSGVLAALPTVIYRDRNEPVARVLVVGGNDRGREFELASDRVLVGRGVDCDIVLADIAVSRRHFVLMKSEGGYMCQDLGSGNGTKVNGRRIREALLANGDEIEAGNTLLRFVLTNDALGLVPRQEHAPGYAAAAAPTAPPRVAPGGEAPRGRPLDGVLAAGPRGAEPTQAPDTPSGSLLPELFERPVEVASGAEDFPGSSTPVVAPRQDAKAGAARKGAGTLSRLVATRRGKLLTFGTLAVMFVLVTAAFVKRVLLPKKPHAQVTVSVPGPSPEQAYEEGVKKFRQGDFEGAKASFEAVLAQVPDFQGARKYVERCQVEMASRAKLQQAKEALGRNDFSQARLALKAVDPASKAGDEAAELLNLLPRKEADFLVQAARGLQEQEDVEGAMKKVEEALAVQPEHKEALALKAELEKGAGGAEKGHGKERGKAEKGAPRVVAQKQAGLDVRARSEPAKGGKGKRGTEKEVVRGSYEPKGEAERVRGGQKGAAESAQGGPVSDKVAMQHYKAQAWGQAYEALKEVASRQKGKQQQKTLALAEDIRKMGQAFTRAEAQANSNPAGAVVLYEQAVEIDKRVGKGVHGPYLKKKLSTLSRSEAQKALAAGRYEQAYSLLKTAERYGGEDATTRGIAQGLENRAKELFEKGYAIKGQKPEEAKALWRRVIKMVPSSSQWYVKAYQYLNELAGTRQRDEDE